MKDDMKTTDPGKDNDAFSALLAIVRRLRSEDGCPWDRAQTHASLTRYLIEETYEVLDAIERENTADLREELGDLLFEVLLHAEIEREEGHFSIGDVAADECEKMIRRHPHVFGDATAEEALSSWEASKSLEKGRRTLAARLASVPRALPALLRAQKLIEKGRGELPEGCLPPRATVDAVLALSGVAEASDKQAAAGRFLLAAVDAFSAQGVDCEAALSYALRGFFASFAPSSDTEVVPLM